MVFCFLFVLESKECALAVRADPRYTISAWCFPFQKALIIIIIIIIIIPMTMFIVLSP